MIFGKFGNIQGPKVISPPEAWRAPPWLAASQSVKSVLLAVIELTTSPEMPPPLKALHRSKDESMKLAKVVVPSRYAPPPSPVASLSEMAVSRARTYEVLAKMVPPFRRALRDVSWISQIYET